MADDLSFAVDPRDEGRHPVGDQALWNESWYFDFVTPDASLGGYVRVGLYPNLGAVWYWACLVGPDRPLVIVADHDVAPPSSETLELRHDALWADNVCEEPLERWSLGLESFAIAVDDPAEMYHRARGDLVPFGFELEWETDGIRFNYPLGLTRYEIPCKVHGEVSVGDERIEVDALGQRDHSWGVRDWWEIGWCWTAFHLDDGSRWHAVTSKPDQQGFGYEQAREEPLGVYGSVTVDEVLGPEGIPSSALMHLGETDVEFVPRAWAPILLDGPDNQVSRFPRGMGRFTKRGGATGVGWIEFNQPQAPG